MAKKMQLGAISIEVFTINNQLYTLNESNFKISTKQANTLIYVLNNIAAIQNKTSNLSAAKRAQILDVFKLFFSPFESSQLTLAK